MQVPTKNPNNNIKPSFTQLLTKFKELKNGFQCWVSKQSLPVEVAVVAATSGIQRAGVGLFYGTLAKFESVNNLIPLENFGKNPSLQARNFAVSVATDAVISCALKRFTGKEDFMSRMAAAFASECMWVCTGPRFNAADAIIYGGLFAAWQGLLHKEVLVHQVFNFSHLPPVLDEESRYTRARCMLSDLGLQCLEKNFKKHLITDNALPLLKDWDLDEADIPIGARVLMLDYIKRYADLPKMQEVEDTTTLPCYYCK